MPHIDVKMFPGRNDEIKKNLAEKLLKTAAEELQIPAENLSVSVEDVDPKKWNEKSVQQHRMTKFMPERCSVQSNARIRE